MHQSLAEAKSLLDRRHFLRISVAGSIPLVLSDLDTFSLAVAAQGACPSQLRGWDTRRLSNAVIDNATSEFARVYNAIESKRSVRVDDVRTAASNTKLLFAHLDEIELTPHLDRVVRECRQDILRFEPPEEQLRGQSQRLAAFGVSLPPARIRELSALPPGIRERAISELARTGISGFANHVVGLLNQAAARPPANQPPGAVGVSSVRKAFQGGGDLMTIEFSQEQCDLLAIDEAILWVLAGLAAFTAIFFPVFVIAAAVLALLAGVTALLIAFGCHT